jgi:hypothetical protein
VDGLKTAAVSTVALVGYPLIGVLALIEANRVKVAGWRSSDGLMPLVVLLFVATVVLTTVTMLLSATRRRTSVLLVFGTIVASFVLLFVLIATATADGGLS